MLHSNNSYGVIIEEYCIEIIPSRKNMCENHTFYHTTNAYNFLWGACYCIGRSVHITKPEMLKFLTKAKLWNVVKYYSQNCQLNILLHVSTKLHVKLGNFYAINRLLGRLELPFWIINELSYKIINQSRLFASIVFRIIL